MSLDLAFSDAGPKTGPVAVALHGFPLDRSMWDLTAAHLVAQGVRVIRPDLRGHGRSPAPDEASTLDRCAADVFALLDKLGITSFWLMGHSFGGYVALEIARSGPRRLKGLLLVNTRASPDTPEAKQKRIELQDTMRKAGSVAPLVEGMLPKLLSKVTVQREPHLVDQLRRVMIATPMTGAIQALHGIMNRPDLNPSLRKVNVPTLVVAGADDEIIPLPEALALNRGIPFSRIRIVTGAGHVVPVEAPEAFHHFLDDWINPASTGKATLNWGLPRHAPST